jgi:hypothetical protein
VFDYRHCLFIVRSIAITVEQAGSKTTDDGIVD